MNAVVAPFVVSAPAHSAKGFRALKQGALLAVVAVLHGLVFSRLATPVAVPNEPVVARPIYASVIQAPAVPVPQAVPAQPAAPPPAVVVPPSVAVAKPVSRPARVPHRAPAVAPPVAAAKAPVSNAISAPASAPVVVAAPVPAPAPTPAPAPIKTVTRGVQYLREPDPQYPDRAREQGEEGTVVLRVQVGVDGKPANVEVLRSSGSASLDAAGMSAARGALFKPYLEDGRPLSVYVIVPLRFQLDS